MDKNLQLNTKIHGFTLIDIADAPDEGGTAFLFEHEESGAKLLFLKNDDNNKSFSVGFKTPPKDSSGVFHILEHSVLQGGSKHFPIKDPFTELRKTSMVTFINACTGQDSTFYPVSSTNEKDLLNLMAVYLDAVFYPNIYDNPAIFLQEGRHFALQKDDDGQHLRCSGVVYNEMKGALKDAFTILINKSNEVLFPDNALGYISGGEPVSIQKLSFEDFKDAHARHYCTDNSFMFLYGNMDIDRFLAFINDKYLSPIISENRPAAMPNAFIKQEAVKAENIECYADIEESEACACIALVINDLNYEEKLAMQILASAIGGSRGCPLRKAFLDAGLANDVSIFYYPQDQGIFYIFCHGINMDAKREAFMDVLMSELKRLSAKGVPSGCLSAALSSAIIHLRMGSKDSNDGFRIASEHMSYWLNCDDKPTVYFNDSMLLKSFKGKVGTGFFEELISSKLLTCEHFASVFLLPGDDTSASDEKLALDKTFAKINNTKSLEKLENDSKIVEDFQNKKNTIDDLKCLPRVEISDLAKQGRGLQFIWKKEGETPYLIHDIDTREMVYISKFYDFSSLSLEENAYLTLLCSLIGKLETSKHSSLDLELLQGEKIADLSIMQCCDHNLLDIKKDSVTLGAKITFPREEVDAAIDYIHEIFADTKFDDKQKIMMIFITRMNAFRLSIISNPLIILSAKILTYYFKTAAVTLHYLLDSHKILKALNENNFENLDDAIEIFKMLQNKIISANCDCISFAGTAEDFENYLNTENKYVLANDSGKQKHADNSIFNEVSLSIENEAFILPADVAYIAAACRFDFDVLDSEQLARKTGVWRVAAKILSLEYLWSEVRIKRGAYGVNFSVNHEGVASFTAFRSPNIDECIQIFKEAGKWLSECNLTKEELEGYIIRAISNIDKPQKPDGIIEKNLSFIRNGYSDDYLAARRRAIFDISIDDIHQCGAELIEASKDLKVCVAANKEMIDASAYDFTLNTIFES